MTDEISRWASARLNHFSDSPLVRFNKRGELNVSYGKRKSVPLHLKHLRAFSAALQDAELVQADFREVMRQAGPGDIVYCDPPYISTFTSYTSRGFSLQDQVDLAAEARAAAARGATVVVSNTDCSLARELYLGAQCRQVEAMRYMSPKAASRGKVAEVLAIFAAARHTTPAATVAKPQMRRRPSMMRYWREMEPADHEVSLAA